MIYNLEQIKRRCDKEKGKLFTIPKNCLGERSQAYPIYTPTTYLRKWDFKDEPAEVLAKYNLEPKEYYYCGSHTRRTQIDRNYYFYRDIVKRKKASKEVLEFFVSYVNYYVNEKKENVVEVVKGFFEAEKMIYLDNRNDAEKIERFENDKLLIRQFKGEPIVLLSDSNKDTTLKFDESKNKLIEYSSHIGEFKENINNMLADLVVRGMKDPDKINEFTSYWFENVEFKEV